MKEYFLTIGIPTLNRAEYLKGLIENIYSELDRSESKNEVQILVVDGSSEDETPQIVQQLNKLGEIKYYRREKRVGVDKDIMKCVELSDGKYCWLFSDDDRLTPGAIDHLVSALKREGDLSGCFCNRTPYDFYMEKIVAEVNRWPGKVLNTNHIFTDKAECLRHIGMDFGFISSQIIKTSNWQDFVKGHDFGELYNSYYLMVHIIAKMMNTDFKWLYISRPMVKQRTGNDSLLNSEGVIKRQMIEHNSFDKIVRLHYDSKSQEYRIFFSKMVNRLPRVIANLKAQNISYMTQVKLLKLLYSKYSDYRQFWSKVIPIFFLPNITFNIIKKLYFKYWI